MPNNSAILSERFQSNSDEAVATRLSDGGGVKEEKVARSVGESSSKDQENHFEVNSNLDSTFQASERYGSIRLEIYIIREHIS
jgi:hypothetical protein